MTGQTMLAVVQVDASQVVELRQYEDAVLALLPDHGAAVERRVRSTDGRVEAHLLTFPSREAIEAHDDDPRRAHARAALDGSLVRGVRYLLTPAEGPDGIVVWHFHADETLGILLERDQELADVDLLLVADVLLEVDDLLESGRRFVRSELGVDGSFDEPEITFYAGQEWVLRFADGPDDVVVVFRGRDPQRLEHLDEGEVVE